MAQASFLQSFGLGTVAVACSFRGNGAAAITSPVIRDGVSSIVASVARTNAGIYTITFAQKMGRLVFGSTSLELAAADDKFVSGFNYDATGQKVITLWIRDVSGGGLLDPAAGDRIGFFGVFSPRTDLRDKA